MYLRSTVRLGSSVQGLCKNMLSVVKVTLAVDCCDETSPIHLLGFALKLDIDEVMAERSYSCETIL